MAPLTHVLVIASSIVLGLLAAIAAYAYSQIRVLSLPISQVFAIFAIILPVANGLLTQTTYRLLCAYPSQARPILYLVVFAFQLIYETIIATMSLTYMSSNCEMEAQWRKLYTNKDGSALRRIQDRLECCGFNSPVDKAWPFPHGKTGDGFGVDQCKRRFGWDTPCAGPWRQSEQTNAGLFFTVAIITFVVKVIVLIPQFSNASWTQSTSWTMRFFERLTTGELEDAQPNTRGNVRLIDGADQVTTEEQYHDEVDGGQEQIGADENSNWPRVEPSGLVTGHGGERWREDV